ncbi:alpha/beta hydrolase [Pararhodobacter sp. CCB-MM2]|uniref:alpha/beta hydrolase n=1 Tax=Pararhodobacter sp. CCB-MM2 TaxID=1786003 RepID=UPI0008330DD8|nr:alpha/beta hydrolase [Pararhodobacter sp. CCB-MM2]
MTIDCTLTAGARVALAEEMRATPVPPLAPEAEALIARCQRTELAVPTRHGPARVYRLDPPGPARQRPVYVNVHGGGFVRPHRIHDTAFCAEIALALDCTVFDLDYRLAPEHPFPVAIEEAHDLLGWLTQEAEALGIDATRIVLGGHSAGGNVATVVCGMLAQSAAARVIGQLLDYPFLDAVTPMADKVEPGSTLPLRRMEAYNVLYAATEDRLSDPRISAVLTPPALLALMPPALVIIAGLDPLRHEARRYAGQLIDAAVDCEVRQFAASDHGFTNLGQAEHAEARAAIRDWLSRRFKGERA